MEYRIISNDSRTRQEEQVQQLIDQQWKPLGGIGITPEDDMFNTWYHQGLTRSKWGKLVNYMMGDGE